MEKTKKILVACPVADVKDYCFDEWIIKANNLTYENKDIFVVDNSEGREYFDLIRNG